MLVTSIRIDAVALSENLDSIKTINIKHIGLPVEGSRFECFSVIPSGCGRSSSGRYGFLPNDI